MSFERYYRDQYNFGVMEGERIGEIRGEARGIEIGRQKMVKLLKSKGMSDDQLAELLDMTPEALRSILNSDKVHE